MTAVMESFVGYHPRKGPHVDFREGPVENGVLVLEVDIEGGRRVRKSILVIVFAELFVVPCCIRLLRAGCWVGMLIFQFEKVARERWNLRFF